MDKQTRNLIQKATQDARNLLESEFGEQLEGVFDILPDGHIAPSPGGHLTAEQRIIRQKLVAAIEHERAGGVSSAEAVGSYLRVASFTYLNRFVALKMLEARGLVQECVSKGEQSSGFKEFSGLAPGLGEFTDKGYRLYIESLFDELSTEIRVLFDRRDLSSLLWPRQKSLEGLLNILNREETSNIWGEDETIGWVYQYFNSSEERKKMREESAAPRNSRELAVRNQFFTPRYVVEFLTDNTLGRIWYEMRKGDTALKDQCRYLVRRPNEIFLAPDEKAPAEQEKEPDLSQEELLKKPAYIEHRPKKDPRDLRVLDPACGSGHFLLYAFDLLVTIYIEGWEDKYAPKSEATGRSLVEDYPEKTQLLDALPGLILQHNLHGIDIDARAAQIAALSLWMRAQKAYAAFNIGRANRHTIKKTNIVTAEPMPGEEDMRKEFTAGIKPRVLGQLVDVVFERMRLAGEAGSLLKIEEEIKDAIAAAGKLWREGPKPEQQFLFHGMADPRPKQQELRFDVKGITDERFWEQAEDRILDALKEYAEKAENGRAVRRRLFAEDAARGLAFIDLCRKRYDVVLMNPPFGSPAASLEDSRKYYPNCGRDIYAMFVERMDCLRTCGGLIGAIQPRTGLFIGTMRDLRKKCYLDRIPLYMLADLGKGVLDDATIRTACYVFGVSNCENAIFIRVGNIENREEKLLRLTRNLTSGASDQDTFLLSRSYFLRMPGLAIAYWIPPRLSGTLARLPRLASFVDIRQGIATGDNFRFLRLFHELPDNHSDNHYRWYSKGGDPVPFISNECLYVNASNDCREMKANAAQKYGSASRTIKNEDTFGKLGITYSQVNDACLKFRIHPPGGLYDMKGPVLFVSKQEEIGYLLSFLNTSAVEDFMRMMTDGRQWHVSSLKEVPFPLFNYTDKATLSTHATTSTVMRRDTYTIDETGHFFAMQPSLMNASSVKELRDEEIEDIVWRAYGADEQEIRSLQRQRELFLERDVTGNVEGINHLIGLLSEAVGCIFGRWDIRIALEPALVPKLPDPFDPLPAFPPGMLVGPDGFPAESGRIAGEESLRARPDATTPPAEGAARNSTIPDSEYALRISWDGILADDPGFNGGQPHRDDIVRRVREVFDLLWKGRAHEIEQEVREVLGVSDLRAHFRKDFFADHIKRYSKSRRKAPIYWQLSTPTAAYSVWLYYHRFTKDTFYKVLNEFVAPKLQFEERELANARQGYGLSPTASQRREIAARETFVAELKAFKEEVARVAPLWNPDLNDGVIINFAPLWRLVPQNRSWQRECKACWDKLVAGDYDWAHLAMHLWPERVVPKCAKDRSLAIAHSLEDAFWEEDQKRKWVPKKVTKEAVEVLIEERTSPSVKAALEELLKAPSPNGNVGRKGKKKA